MAKESKKCKRKHTPSSGSQKVATRARRCRKALEHKLRYWAAHVEPALFEAKAKPMVDHYARLRLAAAACGVTKGLPVVKL